MKKKESHYLILAFNYRHGIDLDNPGNGPPAIIPLNVEANQSVTGTFSDSGDSQGARSADNATPPMHFLTPHVEISMTDTSPYSPVSVKAIAVNPSLFLQYL